MKMKATKERKLLLLAAVVLLMALLASEADAAPYLPDTLEPIQTPALPTLADIDQIDAEEFCLFAESDVKLFGILAVFDASERERITAEHRIRLFEESGGIPRPLEWFAISKLASGLSTCTSGNFSITPGKKCGIRS